MLGYLIILFTIIPAIELGLLIHVGNYIGTGNTIMIIIFTGILGAHLARLQGILVIRNVQHSVERGQVPTDAMMDGLMIFIGGALLLTPGFLTDVIGFLLLIPLSRRLVKFLIHNYLDTRITTADLSASNPRQRTSRISHPQNTRDIKDADFHEI